MLGASQVVLADILAPVKQADGIKLGPVALMAFRPHPHPV